MVAQEKFTGMMVPEDRSKSWDWSMVLTSQPSVIHEISFQAKTQQITLKLIYTELPKCHLVLPLRYHQTIVFYNLSGDISESDFTLNTGKWKCTPPATPVLYDSKLVSYVMRAGSKISKRAKAGKTGEPDSLSGKRKLATKEEFASKKAKTTNTNKNTNKEEQPNTTASRAKQEDKKEAVESFTIPAEVEVVVVARIGLDQWMGSELRDYLAQLKTTDRGLFLKRTKTSSGFVA